MLLVVRVWVKPGPGPTPLVVCARTTTGILLSVGNTANKSILIVKPILIVDFKCPQTGSNATKSCLRVYTRLLVTLEQPKLSDRHYRMSFGCKIH